MQHETTDGFTIINTSQIGMDGIGLRMVESDCRPNLPDRKTLLAMGVTMSLSHAETFAQDIPNKVSKARAERARIAAEDAERRAA